MPVDLLISLTVATLASIATLVLVSLGMAIIFGVMGIINLAHGEFLVLGAYAVLVLNRVGWPVWAGVLAAPILVGAIALVVERLIIRLLYGRLVETMLATWGLSLVIVQVLVNVFGSSTRGFASPLGSFSVGRYTISEYSLVLVGAAALLLFVVFWIFSHTRYGVIARAVAQNPSMAAALGVNVSVIRAVTFMIGAGLAGVAGGLLASIQSVVPTMGQAFIARAFMTVVVGGPSVITGTLAASAVLGTTQNLVAYWRTAVVGQAALLLLAVVLLRLMPEGISGRWKRRL